jgi:O-antigen/teichoic acid export membrane protein
MTSFAPRTSWRRLREMFGSDGLKGRLMRGSMLTMATFGSSKVVRLASNLVMTRLLFPEAFGMMVLVQVVLTGLSLLSDTGLNVSVMQNARGDDRNFLDTVWTIKVIRGVVLWLVACALALPVAALYDEPMIAQILPIVGLTLIAKGLMPTAVNTANRHIRLGRVTVVTIGNMIVGALVTILLAWLLQSVWALVWGTIATSLIKLVTTRRFLPDSGNRFHWDGAIVRELFHFGKWITVGTAARYAATNGDKIILGAFLTLGELGVYNIGLMLAMLCYDISNTVKNKLLLPIYRMRPIKGHPENRRKIFMVRRLISSGGIAATAVLAWLAIPLVDVLYDDRYAMAGPIIVLICLALVPRLITIGAGGVLMAAGDSFRAMHLTVATALVQVPLLWLGASWFGLGGAILAPGLAALIVYPLRAYYGHLYEGWDKWGEAAMLLVGATATGWVCWSQAEALAPLFR